MFLTAKMLAAVWLITTMIPVRAADAGRRILRGHVPVVTRQLAAEGRLPATNVLSLAIGLPLRHEDQLAELLRQLYDPASTNFHKYLLPAEFTARFGPTEADYAEVRAFAETNGFVTTGTHSDRRELKVSAPAGNVEKVFGIALRTYRHPVENRNFYAPDTEPAVPVNLPVADIWGLSDYPRPKPMSHPAAALPMSGSGPSGYYAGSDFRNAYAPGTVLTGAGQTVGLVQFDGYNKRDITNYEKMVGMTNYVSLSNVLIDSFKGSAGSDNDEVCLDIEMAIAMAPGLSQIIVYECAGSGSGFQPNDLLGMITTNNVAKQISSSWGWSGGPSTTTDGYLLQMAAQGQSFFQASGDNDAYTGSNVLDPSSSVTVPIDSTHVTCVGGTTLYMNGSGSSWSSETAWNYNSYGGSYANEGTGGGISSYYAIPYWQTKVDMTSNGGSTTYRNIPDVALTGDDVSVVYTSSRASITNGRAGTSCAAPLWAGFCALVNQQAVAGGGSTNTVGFLNPALYTLATNANYTSCFHDITTGNNIGTNTAGLYYATSGYDLCTGLGTPNGTNLINALAPKPAIITQPSGLYVANGASATLSVVAVGAPSLAFQWRLNGTNLSGATAGTLSFSPAQTSNAGSYTVVVTNAYGAVTSSVAVVNVGDAPAFTVQPANLTLLTGSNAVFNATVTGTAPLAYQWLENGTNISNGSNIFGATNNTLTLSAITTNSAGYYTLAVTNLYGVVTSSVASLTVVLPPTISSTTLTNRTGECDLNTNSFFITTGGTAPQGIQWSLNGAPISGATATNYGLTNLDMSTNTLSVTVTNPYASVSSNVTLSIRDTKAPVISLNGGNPFYVELGGTFTDPGATANDVCVGAVTVTVTGSVNTNATGTNTLTYVATDGHGNTNSATRTVIVRDTTPPTLVWSFTNLVMAAGTHCSAVMPDVTGTNYIIVTDLSGTLTFAQSPTNGATLPLGTNAVVITVKDASGNAAYSTNQIVVLDETPPQIVIGPLSQTNQAGGAASFSVVATACTTLSYQWFFNTVALAAQTNYTLTLTNLTTAAAGNYFAVVSAAGGASTSAVAVLTVPRRPAALALTSSENPSGFREGVNFSTVLMPTNAGGTITFLTNGTVFDTELLAAGAAAAPSLASLPRGTNEVDAVYSGDANVLPGTNSIAQVVTNHPPSAAAVSYTNNLGGLLTIAIAGLSTGWSDADGDAVVLAAVEVSTNGVMVTDTGTALVYSNAPTVADQFVCVLTDGWGGTNWQTVSIVPVDITPRIAGIMLAGEDGLVLTLGGAPDGTYVLETTTNLIPSAWLPAATNTMDGSGVWRFTNPPDAAVPAEFFRLQFVP